MYFLYLARELNQFELLTSRAELAFWLVRITSRAEPSQLVIQPYV